MGRMTSRFTPAYVLDANALLGKRFLRNAMVLMPKRMQFLHRGRVSGRTGGGRSDALHHSHGLHHADLLLLLLLHVAEASFLNF